MPPQAPWSPTAHAFAHHQFSHVANFWKQGRQASFRLEVLPGGQAELNLTFQLPPASEVVPPPSCVTPVSAPQRPIHPLFPESGSDLKSNQISPKVASKRQRKNYRRSVLHRAALDAASSTLPPPVNGSLRQAASACAQRLQADPNLGLQAAKKRPLLDSATSPSNPPPLSQRIRKDLQIGENEVESPEKEVLRSPPFLKNSPAPFSPCLKRIPSPVPLVFTPVPSVNCLNCESVMTPNHQCEELITSSLALCQAAGNCDSEPPVTTLAKSLGAITELKVSTPASQSDLSDDGTPPGSPLLKRIIRPKKFCEL